MPDYPNEHGLMGWLDGDAAFLIYDRYDIWKIFPDGSRKPEQLTRGRETETTYRYLKLDPEEKSIAPDASLLLHQFNDRTKAEGYAWFDLTSGKLTRWLDGEFELAVSPGTLLELADVLPRPHIFKKYHLAEQLINQHLDTLRTRSRSCSRSTCPRCCAQRSERQSRHCVCY